ncbi:MAG: potassium channel family protein [Pseudorhodobacter sp.]
MNKPLSPLRIIAAGLRDAFSNQNVQILLGLTAALITLASMVYHWVEGWGWIDAVYFSVITISTIGYGDLTPQTNIGKVFTIFYVIIGLGLFVAAVTAIANSIISRAGRRPGK